MTEGINSLSLRLILLSFSISFLLNNRIPKTILFLLFVALVLDLVLAFPAALVLVLDRVLVPAFPALVLDLDLVFRKR